MRRRFLVAFAILLAGAVIGSLFVMLATNGYGTAGVDENLVAVGYLAASLGIVLLLSWLSAAAAGGLSARLHWRSWITLPLVLLPALFVELILLVIAGISLAELSR
jgi:uncharacterized membrane protein YhdT